MEIARVVHGTYLSFPFPSRSNLCLSHPVPWESHRNDIPMDKPGNRNCIIKMFSWWPTLPSHWNSINIFVESTILNTSFYWIVGLYAIMLYNWKADKRLRVFLSLIRLWRKQTGTYDWYLVNYLVHFVLSFALSICVVRTAEPASVFLYLSRICTTAAGLLDPHVSGAVLPKSAKRGNTSSCAVLHLTFGLYSWSIRS